MELGGYVVIVCVVVVGLLLKIADLQGLLKELRKKLIEGDIFIIEPLLETRKGFIIDGDADALKIADCVVIYHQKNGQMEWTGVGKFYTIKEPINGHKIHEKLHPEASDQEVLNRNYLDFLVKNQELIPSNWPLIIPFFGTVYRELNSGRCFVKCLSRRDGIYMSEKHYLDTEFDCRMGVILK